MLFIIAAVVLGLYEFLILARLAGLTLPVYSKLLESSIDYFSMTRLTLLEITSVPLLGY